MQKPVSKILRFIRNLLLFFFVSTLLAVIIYRFVPVYVTPLMVIRSVQQIVSGDKPTCKHTWVSFDKISLHLPMAVIASEDNRFAEHNGFDFKEIEKAIKERCEYHQPTDCKKCISLAPIIVGTKGIRGLFHVSHRNILVKRADHDGIPQLYRNG